MFRRSAFLMVALAWGVATMSTAPQATGAPQSPASIARSAGGSESDVRSVLATYCATCHSERVKSGNLVLDPTALGSVANNADVWERVVRKLRTRTMPPAGMPRPTEAVYASAASWLEGALDAVETVNPGRPVLHRLNRTEYANAVRDVLALEVDPSSLFPPDDSADGFDTNAALLGISPVLLERYLSAATRISALAVADSDISANTETYRVRADASQLQHVEGLPLGTRGGLVVRHLFPVNGEYVISAKLLETGLGAIRGLERQTEVDILVDGQRVHRATVGGADDYASSVSLSTGNIKEAIHQRLRIRVPIMAGPRSVGVTFPQGTPPQASSRMQPFLRSTVMATDHTGLPHIESLTVAGPFDATGVSDTPSRQRIFTCLPADLGDRDECAREIIGTLARRAYRRPVSVSDVDRLMTFFRSGSSAGEFDKGIQLALRAILASPQFVLRAENDPPGTAQGTPYRVSDVELATRLSFFLWSSIPDDELLDLAERKQLRSPSVLERQVRRMLADQRSDALVRNFAGQWLHLRNLSTVAPDRYQFPDFDDNLRQAFGREVELLFESIVREDRDVFDLFTADYTFVNERLARHYGIPHVYGSHFRRVAVTDDVRKGLLGKGAVLLVTSNPDRTSPVKRGQWILENLLGTPPPPPPPNVPELEAHGEKQPLTMRQRMERHRASPQCAACHKIMDPLGLALENFDAVGAWRSNEGGRPIDASGELADGTKIDGVVALRQALQNRHDVVVQTMTEKLLTYALRRSVAAHDMPAVRKIVRDTARGNYRFSSLVLGIVNSTPFQMRLKQSLPGPL